MGACGSSVEKGTDLTFDTRRGTPVKNPEVTNSEEMIISSPFNVNLGFYKYTLDYDLDRGVYKSIGILGDIELNPADHIIIRPSHLPKVERQLGIKIDNTVPNVDTSQHRRRSSDSTSCVTYIYDSDDKEIQQIIKEEKYCIAVLKYNNSNPS